MSPEKIAIAVAVTIAAMAGIGAMKNVTGTSSAVAIVAVKPGHGADEKTEQRRREHHPQVVRLEHELERKADVVHRASPCARAIRSRDQNANRSSTPHGNGTRSSL